MKAISLICSLVLIFFTSCESIKEQENNTGVINIEELIRNNTLKISLNTGIAGTLLTKEGNCMPMVPTMSSTCRTYPVSKTIMIYEFTNMNEAEGWGPLFTSVNSKFISQCDADQNGFFQLAVDPGKYSIFIKENGKFYANSFDGFGGIYPVVVQNDSVSIIKLVLDYAVY